MLRNSTAMLISPSLLKRRVWDEFTCRRQVGKQLTKMRFLKQATKDGIQSALGGQLKWLTCLGRFSSSFLHQNHNKFY